jgi:hypothetical protein
MIAKRQFDKYCSTWRIALPLASTSYWVQAKTDSIQGFQEVQQMDRAQVQVPAVVVMQLPKQRV